MPIIIGGGAIAALLLFAAASTPAARRVEEKVADFVENWIETLLRKTSAHEGTFGSVNHNKDGQGVSYGIIQWTQLSGNLGKLLAAMYAADPAAFRQVFGPAWQQLLDVTRRASLEPVDGQVLWGADWSRRFAAAGAVQAFRAVQVQMASTGDHMQAAIANAVALEVTTERGMVLCYNRSVHQGVGGSTGPRKALLEWWASHPGTRPASVNDRLAQYAWSCASNFRRTTVPVGRVLANGFVAYNRDGTIWWQPVTREQSELKTGDYRTTVVACSGVWHAVGGMGSLYDLIVRRSSDILLDPEVRDAPVRLPALVA